MTVDDEEERRIKRRRSKKTGMTTRRERTTGRRRTMVLCKLSTVFMFSKSQAQDDLNEKDKEGKEKNYDNIQFVV